ncbi:hypothetical protein F442_12936 [Phytophthora nicotianae P10297]|uniref:Uncharacterized protein n=4 Tax=Phytophthora nicotianae TaxID=4792 RepID=W2R3R5_PHYN3|nr:hypothetical protein PPTG_21207 [Phytophthora nicotianae INRA-310]ETI41743.1 hypothetical protein F443_13041 [Phytophthora nicotianae P1569]ETL88430.1 hypothetical protein L917_12491 [Phytophthora nicotianae]ETP39611.1 hypothetical protein F442_12936 [Phytophthora nicotianae P10297]ETM41675.1 hypothetical protein L914_12567 [Phytophthora nicotianae]ETN20028.1 hypothetical protein PPTG_21207 [Phytophthora nicotianae INRA-310]
MSLSSEVQATDEQFLTEILSLLDVDEGRLPLSGDLPQPKLRKLRPHPESDIVVRPKRIRKEPTPRVRNKAKIELLRHEVKGLEAVLASLQNSSRGATTVERRRAASLWRIIAMKQSHERQLAEQRNMGLRRMLFEQFSLTRSLTHVLDEWTNLPSTDLSLSASHCFCTCLK